MVGSSALRRSTVRRKKSNDMDLDDLRDMIPESFPDIPENEREDFLDEVKECVYRYGAPRTASIGRAVELLVLKDKGGRSE